MAANKLEVYDESQLLQNPFSFGLTVPVVKMYSDETYKYHPPEADGETGTYLKASFYGEQQQYTRLYYCPGCVAMVYNLSDKAQRLFIYILYHLMRKKDYVQLNREDYMRKNNVKSRTTYLAAVDELLRYSFLSPTKYNTVFWINPMLFSSTDRISKYPDRIKEKAEL